MIINFEITIIIILFRIIIIILEKVIKIMMKLNFILLLDTN